MERKNCCSTKNRQHKVQIHKFFIQLKKKYFLDLHRETKAFYLIDRFDTSYKNPGQVI